MDLMPFHPKRNGSCLTFEQIQIRFSCYFGFGLNLSFLAQSTVLLRSSLLLILHFAQMDASVSAHGLVRLDFSVLVSDLTRFDPSPFLQTMARTGLVPSISGACAEAVVFALDPVQLDPFASPQSSS